ncbi:L-seryl-tRNA(Sec) selenium transferase [Mesobacillus boroniphilus]|uniref:L-seryl-tRNA(Sec) selenium transferase n=1 Tax=Mesobacillus boroniphilus TaxID=308892 RepID=A0A944CKU0_9BACI|nr:L-seryl-tRNA(Sec) selenium transferase [Mesobacillus boroniphilus]MBS8264181.1 L-seryl-tRNA(Sec) selenium transferase [Mesobacillus boroniphilus]
MKHLLRQLPAVHELQKDNSFLDLANKYGIETDYLTEIIKDVLNDIRTDMVNENWSGPEPGTESFVEQIFALVDSFAAERLDYTLKRVINATGTILHTNLGRARLSENAMKHVMDTAMNYSNLEYKIDEGERGSRHSHVESLIKKITGAEAAMVVNNNAAAVFIILSALAKEKEVVVSRGQLVEIGGSFRISSIMEESGARLVEVGTTNKTHLHDYDNVITDQTSMILKVHTSNFKIFGFSKTVETDELAELSSKHEHVIFYEDLGSGVLYDFKSHGIGDEPVVSEVLKMGADIVSFSGDKLLGGPQAGIIAGKKELIDQLKKHQLARVVRVDKMTLAALEGTLMDYLRGVKGMQNIPTLRCLLVPPGELKSRAESFVQSIHSFEGQLKAAVSEGTSQVGGGTMPDVELPTYLVTISHPTMRAEYIARKLRTEFYPAIIVRIHKEEVQIDLRTVDAEEVKHLLEALKKI